jgi:uracil-DNA glycosylase
MALWELNEQIRKCRKCRLWQGAHNAVPGEGPVNAKVMLVGQNPGAEEDKAGRPFVGRAGKYLDKVLTKTGLCRDNTFVTNVVKHISPKNRKPLPDEIAACTPYLLEQIKKIKPKIIVLMGTVAWQVPRVAGIKCVETYHPSAAMRFTKMKKKFEADFVLLSETLRSHL